MVSLSNHLSLPDNPSLKPSFDKLRMSGETNNPLTERLTTRNPLTTNPLTTNPLTTNPLMVSLSNHPGGLALSPVGASL